jgi:hypothetical protein
MNYRTIFTYLVCISLLAIIGAMLLRSNGTTKQLLIVGAAITAFALLMNSQGPWQQRRRKKRRQQYGGFGGAPAGQRPVLGRNRASLRWLEKQLDSVRARLMTLMENFQSRHRYKSNDDVDDAELEEYFVDPVKANDGHARAEYRQSVSEVHLARGLADFGDVGEERRYLRSLEREQNELRQAMYYNEFQ